MLYPVRSTPGQRTSHPPSGAIVVPSLAPVKQFLSDYGVEVLTYREATPTAPAAARAVGCSVGEIAKTLLFIVGGTPLVVVTSGDQKVLGSKLKRGTGLTGKVRLPDATQVERHTGYSPGGVCPFLLPDDLRVVVDVSLKRFETVYPAAGDDHSAAPITVARLLEITGGAVVDACVPLPSPPDLDNPPDRVRRPVPDRAAAVEKRPC